MEIIVSGHQGFIGSHIVEELKKTKHQVITLNYDLRFCELPIGNAWIHLASNMGGIGFFTDEQFEPIIDNTMMDIRIIEHCRKYKMRLLYPSSACAYSLDDMNNGVGLYEQLLNPPYNPDQMYGFEKLFITKLAQYADFDFRVAVLHTIYGERQEFMGKKAKFVPQMCYKFLTQDQIDVWGSGNQTRTFLHVKDAVKMMLEIFFAEKYYGEVNISGEQEVKIKDVVKILSNYTGKKNIKYDLSKPEGPTRRAVNLDKFNKHYTTRPTIDLETGVKNLFDYVKSNCNITSVLS